MMKTAPLPLLLVAIVAWLGPHNAFAEAPKPRYGERWVYNMNNLLVDENADRLVTLIGRMEKAGYNGLVLADYKFNLLAEMPPNYFKNVARVREAADAAHVEIIPAIFPVGYSNGLLMHDPNLAEGLPVVGAPFEVKSREAVLAPDPSARLVNGDLEEANGDVFKGFSYQDDPGKVTFADRRVIHQGKVSCRMEGAADGNCRLIQRVKVRPHACYRFSCWVKTRDLKPTGGFRLLALGGSPSGRPLTFQEGQIESTRDWKRIDVVFNSLDETDVNLYAGVWGGRSGTIWLDELALEELALVNVLRRDGCPVIVTSDDGRTSYVEGEDFEPIRDQKLGQVPYAGEYEFDHPGAPVRLTPGSRIKDGARLRISWYHPVLTVGDQVMCCLSDPKVDALLRDQARRVEALLHPKTIMMSHDEIRVANWCRSCRSRKQTPGALLADNARRCATILKEVSPGVRVVIWSDMFDPFHNAVASYFLVNGSLEGSWEGLSADVIIANWNSGKAAESLKWFAGRGHPQVIAGYYDVDDLSGLTGWDAAAQGVPKVIGFMYTTWEAKYNLLEAYGKALRGSR